MPVQRAHRNHPNRQIAQQENNGCAALMAEELESMNAHALELQARIAQNVATLLT